MSREVGSDIEIRVLSGADIRALLPMAACIDLMAETMKAVSDGRARFPQRSVMPATANGLLASMPGALTDPACFGVKLLSLFPNNPAAGLSSHLGLVLLFEPEHGRPVAMLDAAELTATRTAAVSGLATRLLAHEDAGDLALLGSGEQAASHLTAMLAVRNIRRVRVWSRTAEHAAAFAAAQSQAHGRPVEVAESPEAAVAGADLICTVSAAPEPILLGRWLRPGVHVNAVGASRATTAEIDTEAVVKSRYVVDSRASARNEAGEYLRALEAGAIDADHIVAEIGEVAAGQAVGRRTPADITVFKSLGVAAEDLAAGWRVLEAARAKRVGQVVRL